MRAHLDDHCSEWGRAARLPHRARFGPLPRMRLAGWPALKRGPPPLPPQFMGCTQSRKTVVSWVELLPRCVLVAHLRAGSRHRPQAGLAIKRWCQRWLDGERLELWDEMAEHLPKRGAAAGERSLEARQSRCCSLAAVGELA